MSVHLFKKGDKSNGKVKSSQEDLFESEDTEPRSKAANGNRTGGYEQTDPIGLGVTANGPNRASMAAMRDEGKILTVSILSLFPFFCTLLSFFLISFNFTHFFFVCLCVCVCVCVRVHLRTYTVEVGVGVVVL